MKKTFKWIPTFLAAAVLLFPHGASAICLSSPQMPNSMSCVYSAPVSDDTAKENTGGKALCPSCGSQLTSDRQGEAEENDRKASVSESDLLRLLLDKLLEALAEGNKDCFFLQDIFTDRLNDYMAGQLSLYEAEAADAKGSLQKEQMGYTDPLTAEVLLLVNEARQKEGLQPLEADMRLFAAAEIRAAEIQQVFSHTRPNGESCFTVLADIEYSRAGENIALGQTGAVQVFNAWLDSPGHRDNIMDPDFGRIGLAAIKNSGGSGYAWVQIFAD